MKIRPYKKGDEESCQSLNEIVMRWQGHAGSCHKEDLDDITKSYCSSGGAFYVAESAGKIIGTIGLKQIGDSIGFLKRFRVHPDSQGEGIGFQLLSSVVEYSKSSNIKTIFICTGKQELAAHHLYEKAGATRKAEVNFGKDYFFELALEAN